VEIRGVDGHLIWVGDPGVGELVAAWSEGSAECESYRLHLRLPGRTEQETERERRRIAASLS
jgi:hypothetical protein